MSAQLLCCHDGCQTDTGKTKRFMSKRTLILHYAKVHFNAPGKDYGEKLLNYCLGENFHQVHGKYYCDACYRNFNKMKEYKAEDVDKLFYHYCDQHFNDSQYEAVYEVLSTNWRGAIPTAGDTSFESSRHSSRASSFGSDNGTEFRFAQDQAEMEELRKMYPVLNPTIMQFHEYKNLVASWGKANADRFYHQLEEEAIKKKRDEEMKVQALIVEKLPVINDLSATVNIQAEVIKDNSGTINKLTPEQRQINELQQNMAQMMAMMQKLVATPVQAPFHAPANPSRAPVRIERDEPIPPPNTGVAVTNTTAPPRKEAK